MFLHSGLTVVDWSEHSFHPFPDKGRVLPWGMGCSIVHNDVDLVVRNDTGTTYQVLVSVGERHLYGQLRADRPNPLSDQGLRTQRGLPQVREHWSARTAEGRCAILTP